LKERGEPSPENQTSVNNRINRGEKARIGKGGRRGMTDMKSKNLPKIKNKCPGTA